MRVGFVDQEVNARFDCAGAMTRWQIQQVHICAKDTQAVVIQSCQHFATGNHVGHHVVGHQANAQATENDFFKNG